MNKTLVIVGLLLLAAPLAYAHTNGIPGTPKDYCEDAKGDYRTHDYGFVPATGRVHRTVKVIGVPGLGGGGTGASGGPQAVGGAADGAPAGACPTSGWNGIEGDGHYEFAYGGAFLLACPYACTANFISGGSYECWGTYADHTWSRIYVQDKVLLGGVPFTVAADHGRNGEPCGDGIVEPCTGATYVGCNPLDQMLTQPPAYGMLANWADPTFRPGADGSYAVFVGSPSEQTATVGHVWTLY